MSFDDVLAFWLGPLDADGLADEVHRARWWRSDPDFDAELRARFGALHAEVAAGDHASWLTAPRGRLATVIVFDQLSRNLFRGTAGMYAHDARAVALTKEALEGGDADVLGLHERMFLAMPLMHAEALDDQERCIEEMRALARRNPAFEANVDFAIRHRDVVARFGRFPHRNAILGRESSEEEREFLKQPGSSF